MFQILLDLIDEEVNEDSKLIDDASSVDDDEQFFDALDEHDKGVYNVIKSKYWTIFSV